QRLLSHSLRQSGGDAALIHHDRRGAARRVVRSSGTDHAHTDRRRFGGAVVRAGIDRASEFSDVVCRDIGADRRLRARHDEAALPRRLLARRARRALGRQRNRRLDDSSLLAGLATTPYAAYHFHRIAPYGVIANLLAMPVV